MSNYEIQIFDNYTSGTTETFYDFEDAVKRYDELIIGKHDIKGTTGSEENRIITSVCFKEIKRIKNKDTGNKKFW